MLPTILGPCVRSMRALPYVTRASCTPCLIQHCYACNSTYTKPRDTRVALCAARILHNTPRNFSQTHLPSVFFKLRYSPYTCAICNLPRALPWTKHLATMHNALSPRALSLKRLPSTRVASVAGSLRNGHLNHESRTRQRRTYPEREASDHLAPDMAA